MTKNDPGDEYILLLRKALEYYASKSDSRIARQALAEACGSDDTSLCDDCDVLESPGCNRCLGC